MKKEEAKNEIINEKNKINYKEDYRAKFKNNIVINDNLKKKPKNQNEINKENSINETCRIAKSPINLDLEKQEKDENKLYKKNNDQKNNEVKIKTEEQKEMKSKNNITTRDYPGLTKKDDNKNFGLKNKLNIDVDKTQLSNAKRTYLINTGEKEGTSMKNLKSNKIDKDIANKSTNQNNNYSKYIYSYSVEKRNPNDIKEKIKSPIEKKKNDINNIQNIQNKNNEQKEKEQKHIFDFKSQIRTGNNNNFLTICIKKDADNNKENKLENKDNIRKEINISKINNTNLVSAEKNNYTYISTLNYSSKKENEKNNNNDNTKENQLKNTVIKTNNNINRVSKVNNDEKKENKINLSNLETNIDLELMKQNNLKTLNSTSYKNSNRINHNYMSIKSTIPKTKSKADKTEQSTNSKNINNKEIQ